MKNFINKSKSLIALSTIALSFGVANKEVEAVELTEGHYSVDSEGIVEYIIQPGDTLSQITEYFGIDLSDLINALGIENPDMIIAGNVITFNVATNTITYTDASGLTHDLVIEEAPVVEPVVEEVIEAPNYTSSFITSNVEVTEEPVSPGILELTRLVEEPEIEEEAAEALATASVDTPEASGASAEEVATAPVDSTEEPSELAEELTTASVESTEESVAPTAAEVEELETEPVEPIEDSAESAEELEAASIVESTEESIVPTASEVEELETELVESIEDSEVAPAEPIEEPTLAPVESIEEPVTPPVEPETPSQPLSAHDAFDALAAEKGLTQAEIEGWSYIIDRESGWDPQAENPTSGAYGLAQNIDRTRYASHGDDYLTNPVTQLEWMYDYMDDRYGGVQGALDFWNQNHWY